MKSKFVCSLLNLLIGFFVIAPQVSAQTDQGNRQLTQGTQPQQNSPSRLALVIGNGGYQFAGKLANPPHDATLVAATLRQLGFEVKSGSNLTQREMKQRIREFGQNLRTNGGVGLFYFAGHGVQAKGHNYLVPVDADIQTEADLEDVAVDLNYVLNLMDDAQNALNIVILDACRNNPFARSFRSAQEGLAQVKAPTGTLIAYATAPDSIAADGTGSNSPYTEELIKQMQASGVLVETMFRRVTEQVSARTNGKQEPWFSANVKGDFYFSGSATRARMSDAGETDSSLRTVSTSKLDPAAIELSYWESIKNSSDIQDFNAYLQKYPDGQFASLARNRIRSFDESSRRASAVDTTTPVSRENLQAAEEYRKRGDALRSQKNYTDAATQYLSAIRLRPDYAEAQYELGWIYNELKQYSEAIEPLKAAIRSNPVYATAESELGYSYKNLKRYDEALEMYRQAIRHKPDYASAYYNIGWIQNERRQYNEALAALKEATRLKADYADAYCELGYAYQMLNSIVKL